MRIDIPGSSASGTVTSVSGTTSQIDSTGGATPVLSIDQALDTQFYAVDTGAGGANVYTVNPPIAWTSYAAGQTIRFKVANAATGASTINVSGLGAKSLQKMTTGALAALGASGDLVTAGTYTAVYDGTVFVLQDTSSAVYTGGTLTAGSMLRGNSNNQLQGTAGIGASASVFTSMNTESLSGVGVPYTRGQTLNKAETGSADANVLTVTTPATAGVYRISVAISVTSATAGVIAWTASWTDSSGNAQANIAMPLTQLGTAAPNTTFTTSTAGDYFGVAIIQTTTSAASIVIKWVGGGTSAAIMSAIVERIGL